VISAYRELFGVRRARALVASSLLGRLSTGAYLIPLVLLIQGTTHSFALAGTAEAANLATGAISAPARGRALDRHGSRVVLPRVAVARAALFAAMWPVAHTRMAWAIVLLAVIAGAASPQLATAMRLQWQHLLGREDPRLQQAYAFEASAQVAMFVIGPLLSAAGLATIGAGATLAATGLFLIAGALVFGVLAVDDRASGSGGRRRSARVLAVPGIRTLVLTALIADSALGMIDITVTAFAKRHGQPSAAGLLLAIFALTSVLTSAVLGARTWRMPARKRLVVLTGTAALLTPLLALGHSIAAIAGLLVLAGAPFAAQWSTTFIALDQVAPRDAAAEALSWLSAANAAGVGIGDLLAGAIVQSSGPLPAFITAACLQAIAATIVLARQRTLIAS
jgi:MFS family permease